MLAVAFALLHCSTYISNQDRKSARIYFKFGTFCSAAGKLEKDKEVPFNATLIPILQHDNKKTLLILHKKLLSYKNSSERSYFKKYSEESNFPKQHQNIIPNVIDSFGIRILRRNCFFCCQSLNLPFVVAPYRLL